MGEEVYLFLISPWLGQAVFGQHCLNPREPHPRPSAWCSRAWGDLPVLVEPPLSPPFVLLSKSFPGSACPAC